MSDGDKDRAPKRVEPPASGRGAVSHPPASHEAETGDDASERLLRAEGADGPQRSARRRRSGRGGAPSPAQKTQADETRGLPRADAPSAPELSPPPPPTDPNLHARIRDLEARLDAMLGQAAGDDSQRRYTLPPLRRPTPPSTIPPPRPSETAPSWPPPAPSVPPPPASRPLLLETHDPRAAQWGRLAVTRDPEAIDEYGYDPSYERRVLPFFEFLYKRYFRVETHDVERVPAHGKCLLVANHSGVVPLDGMMLRMAVRHEHPRAREVRWLAEDAIFHFPFLGTFANRLGAVRACQENAARLLAHDELVAVFPEGMKGIGKLFRDRYRLQRFGRGGFVKLCLRTRTPIVPVAIVGSEEANPLLGRVEYLTRAIGLPYLPITPTFPWLGPFGLWPAPTKWKIYFGERIDLGGAGPESADDEILVGQLAERVRAQVQTMLDRALAERRSVWFG